MKYNLGATGKFPRGKKHPGDEGELRFAIGRDAQGNVHVNFGKDVSWFALPPDMAVEMARTLARHAGAKKIEIEL